MPVFNLNFGPFVVQPYQCTRLGAGSVLHINGLVIFYLLAHGTQRGLAILLINGGCKAVTVGFFKFGVRKAEHFFVVGADEKKCAVRAEKF